jgi:ubiquinone/menaquinone biosynthesis C-methylase UbiE
MVNSLRKFHNYVKETFLEGTKIDLLIDFGCGHGGDIHKWTRHGVSHAIGIDPDNNSILEARRRTENANYIFIVDDIGWLEDAPCESVDVITCNFVIHYFDKSQQIELLTYFHRMLVKGGRVQLTFMEGSRVFSFLENQPVRDNGVVKIELNFPKMRVVILDTLYFEAKGYSDEYLVFQKFLHKEAIKIGFESSHRSFESYYRCYKGPTLTKQEQEASFLFASMVLYK